MRLISKQLTRWLNIWLIFTLLGSLLSPALLASASSHQTDRAVWQNNNFLVKGSQANSESDTLSTINKMAGQEAIASNNQLPVQLDSTTPRTFSLPFNSNLEMPTQKPALSPLHSEWSTPTQISTGSFGGVAIRSNWAYVVWDVLYDNIFLAKSSDSGQNWNPTNEQVTNYDDDVPSDSAIAVDPNNGTIYVAYSLHPPESTSVPSLARSTDNGQNWSYWSIPGDGDIAPKIAIDHSSNLYSVWSSNGEIKIARSTNGGQTWSPEVAVENNLGCATTVWDVATAGNGSIYIVWLCSQQVRVTKSVDGGQTWVDKPALRDNPDVGLGYPVIALDGSDKVYVVWREVLLTSDNFFATSQDGGDTWSNPVGISSSFAGGILDIGVRGSGQLVLGWKGDNALHVAESEDNGQQWSTALTEASIDTFALDADPATGTAVVAWTNLSGQIFAVSSPGNSLPLTLDLLDPQGLPVTQVITNADGWPTPNPLTVQVTLNCPAGGPSCGNQFHLLIDSNLPASSNQAARFYVYSKDLNSSGVQVSCVETTGSPSSGPHSYTVYEDHCFEEPVFGTLTLDAGETKIMRWQVWIQPSVEANLEFSAFWGISFPTVGETNSKVVQVPLAEIRPLIFLPGFSATFPPEHGGQLDPLFNSYDNLVEALQRVGYELGTPNSGATFIPFGFDWRVPLGLTGKFTLANDVQAIREFSTNGQGKSYVDYEHVDMIGHSTGGIVARAFIEDVNADNQDYVYRLITVGTPHRGLPPAYRGWYGGDFDAFGATREEIALLLTGIANCEGNLDIFEERYWNVVNDPIRGYDYIRNEMESVEDFLPVSDVTPGYLVKNESPFDDQEYFYQKPLNNFLEDLNNNVSVSNVGDYDIDKLAEVPSVMSSFNAGLLTLRKYKVDPPPTGSIPAEYWKYGEITDPNWQLGNALEGYGNGDGFVPAYSADLTQVINSSNIETFSETNGPPITGFNPPHLFLIDHPIMVRRLISRITGLDITANEDFWNEESKIGPSLDTIAVYTCSPVRTLVTDPQGRQAGLDKSTGQVINEIPGAIVTEDGTEPHFILLPQIEGQYQVEAIGTAQGDYQLGILQAITTTRQIMGSVLSGTTTLSQSHRFTFEPSYFQESGGQVVLEVEHSIWGVERSQRNWITQTNLSGYTGPAYLSALPDTDLQFTINYTKTSPELQYAINFTTTGIYTVWVRSYAPNAAGDSMYVTLDNQSPVLLTGFIPGVWSWAAKGSDIPGGLVTFAVAEPGIHTLRLWQREDGLRLDRIVLTTATGYNPSGNGPSESERRTTLME